MNIDELELEEQLEQELEELQDDELYVRFVKA